MNKGLNLADTVRLQVAQAFALYEVDRYAQAALAQLLQIDDIDPLTAEARCSLDNIARVGREIERLANGARGLPVGQEHRCGVPSAS